jgi:hypothetical protein
MIALFFGAQGGLVVKDGISSDLLMCLLRYISEYSSVPL